MDIIEVIKEIIRKAGLLKISSLLLLTLTIIIVYPVSSFKFRIALIANLLLLYGAVIFFKWKNKIIRYCMFIPPSMSIALLSFPGTKYDSNTYRQKYVNELSAYDGVKYILGGENRWIEADPDSRRVIIAGIPSGNHWFNIPVIILKWTFFR